jgi:hypothetical protein
MARFQDTKQAAHRIQEKYGVPISPRTLESWDDLRGRVINRKRLHTDEEIDAAAERRIREAEAKRAAAQEAVTLESDALDEVPVSIPA